MQQPEPAPPAEATTAAPSPVMEKAAALVVLGFGVAMLVGARMITVRNETGGVDPRWWPTVIAGGIVACGAWMLFNSVLGRGLERQVEPATRPGWFRMAMTVVGIAVVLILWGLGVSFVLLAPLLLVALNWLYGLRSWTSLLLFPGIIAGLLFAVFQLLLKVPL